MSSISKLLLIFDLLMTVSISMQLVQRRQKPTTQTSVIGYFKDTAYCSLALIQ